MPYQFDSDWDYYNSLVPKKGRPEPDFDEEDFDDYWNC